MRINHNSACQISAQDGVRAEHRKIYTKRGIMTVLTTGIIAFVSGSISVIGSQFIDPNKPKKKPYHASNEQRQKATFRGGIGMMLIGIVIIILHFLLR